MEAITLSEQGIENLGYDLVNARQGRVHTFTVNAEYKVYAVYDMPCNTEYWRLHCTCKVMKSVGYYYLVYARQYEEKAGS